MSKIIAIDSDRLNRFLDLVQDSACFALDAVQRVLPNDELCHQTHDRTRQAIEQDMSEILELHMQIYQEVSA